MIRNWLHSLNRLENALRFCAVVILVVGLSSSILIWRAQDRIERSRVPPQPGGSDVVTSPLEDRKQLAQLELYGGQSAVLMEEAKGLFRGKTLAKTVAVISILTAAGLLLVTVQRRE